MVSVAKIRCVIFGVLVTGMIPLTASAQTNTDEAIHAVARQDGRAFIYHTKTVPFSHGFHVYRSKTGEKWEKLTEQPFYPAQDGYEFRNMVGDVYPQVKKMVEREEPQAVFLRLRDSEAGKMVSFAVPRIASALGRLYIDEEATIGQAVYYRFEIVDDLGTPTGDIIKGKVKLEPHILPAPTRLNISNRGKQISLRWHYVPHSTPAAENVIRFQIFYHRQGSNELKKGNAKLLARTMGDTNYYYSFEVPETNIDYVFRVHAVDFTGAMSKPSKEKILHVRENIPPSIVTGVKARESRSYTSQITWPVSTDLDLAGYHIYRTNNDNDEYKRINKTRIPPLQTVYVDSMLAPGTSYRYKITAVDTSGNEGEKSNAAHVFIVDRRVPEPVPALDAKYEKEAIKLNWDRGPVAGKLRTYFLLRRRIDYRSDNSFTQLNDTQLRRNTFTDRGIGGNNFLEGATYQYGIAVISENGITSDTVYARVKIPDVTSPESPQFIRVKMQQGQRVSLNWGASLSSDAIKYRLYRTGPSAADSLLAELPKGHRSFRDDDVHLGKAYRYTVSAVDSLGNESRDRPADTLFVQRINPPAPARNVQALKTERGVLVAWEPTADEHVTGYHIYKSMIPTGVYKQIGRVKSNASQWTDEAGAVKNWYKVFPVDGSGKEARTATPIRVKVNDTD